MWREHFFKVQNAVEEEHSPTQVCYVSLLQSGQGHDKDDELLSAGLSWLHVDRGCETCQTNCRQLVGNRAGNHSCSSTLLLVAMCCLKELHILDWPLLWKADLCDNHALYWHLICLSWMDYFSNGEVFTNTHLNKFVNQSLQDLILLGA